MAEPLTTPLEIVRTRSLASLVAQEIERMILSGELPAGERINEQALAARLGVSRGPVREAVRGLERSGLVVTVVNQGSYVRKVSAEEALDLYDLRALLIGHACGYLAAHATPAQRARLGELVRRMEAAAAGPAGDAAGYYALNLDFHAALLEFAGNARARRIYEDLGNELHLFRRRALVAPENMAESNAEHAAILAAIAAGDAAAARAAGERHVRGGKRRFTATSAPAAEHGVNNDNRRPQRAGAAAQGGNEGHERDEGRPAGARVRAAGRAARRGGRG